MKDKVKFALRLAGTLTAISVVVAGLLGLVNNVTADKIAEANRVKTENAMMEVVEIDNPSFSDALAVSEEMTAAAAAFVLDRVASRWKQGRSGLEAAGGIGEIG